MTYPDAELAQWIEDSLLMDPRVSAHAIQISVHAGVVTLEGTVHADEKKRVALAIAGAHPSCRGVVDCLRFVAPGRRADNEIAQNAGRALGMLTHSVREAARVSVAAGVVTLRGTVPTEWERAVAADVVLAVPGVRQVTNNLNIAGAHVPPARRADSTEAWRSHGQVAT